MKELKQNFDERQKIERGKAFTYGYWTLFGMLILSGVLRDWLDLKIFDADDEIFISISVSVLIISIYCICKEAYDGIYRGANKATIIILGITNIVFFVGGIKNGVTEHFGMLTLSLTAIIICIYYWIDYFVRKKRDA